MKKYLIATILLFLCLTVSAQTFNDLNKKFNEAYANQQWDNAKEYLLEMREISPESSDLLYNLVCVTSLNNDTELSLSYLKRYINEGFTNISQLENDSDLNNISKTEGYINLVSTLKSQLESYKLPEGEQELIIRVPPLMECYAIMIYLGNPNHPLITKHKKHQYLKSIDSFFAEFKGHALVKKLAEMYPGEPWQNNLRAHHNLRALYIYNGLDTSQIIRYPIEIKSELAGMVQEFAFDTDFITFYNKNSSFYGAMKRIIRSNYSFGSNVIGFFNSNFNKRFSRFNFYFTPLWGGWQHGPSIDVDGYRECFYFGGCFYSSSKKFYYPDQTMQFLALTEFDHATINPLTEQFMQKLKPLEGQVKFINSDEKSNYGSLESTLNEYLTWAFALQYFYEYSPDAVPRLRKLVTHNMTSRGFNRFDEFMSFYENYINDRSTYPMLEDFYPEVVTWIAELK